MGININNLDLQFNPDWTHTYKTADAIERDLENGKFRYRGTGWYLTEKDSLLILWDIKSQQYNVMCWNKPNARECFLNLLSIPVVLNQG